MRVACQANSEVDPEKAKKVKTRNVTTTMAIDVAILKGGRLLAFMRKVFGSLLCISTIICA